MSSPHKTQRRLSTASREPNPGDDKDSTLKPARPKPTRARSGGTIPGQFKFRLGVPPPSTSAKTTTAAQSMSDGKNEMRAMRVVEIMNDFRTLQVHITSLVTREGASAPDEASYYLDGYVVLRQCNAEAQAILATHYNPGSLGLEGGQIADTEVQKATLQRIILDASTRRFQAHKIYLRSAAAMRWVHLRQQAEQKGDLSPGKLQQAYRVIDQRLREELAGINDEAVVNDLRGADARKSYWLDEDPSLERMLTWIRRQR